MADPITGAGTAGIVVGAIAMVECVKWALPLIRGRKPNNDGIAKQFRDHEKLDGHPVLVERVDGVKTDLVEIKRTLRRIEAAVGKGE